ncbi:MAG: hypothetical protein ACE5DM_03935 [Candidatus Nanoarchaeia archaeon]
MAQTIPEDKAYRFDYLRFGTRYKDSRSAKTEIDAPWKVYAVGGKSYFGVEAAGDDSLGMIALDEGSNEHGKIKKWVEDRGILNVPCAGCILSGPMAALETLLDNGPSIDFSALCEEEPDNLFMAAYDTPCCDGHYDP